MNPDIISAIPRGRFAITAAASFLVLAAAFGARTLHFGDAPIAYHAQPQAEPVATTTDEIAPLPDMPLWQQTLAASTTSGVSGTPDDVALAHVGDAIADGIAGSYVALKQAGVYTPESAQKIGEYAAADMRLSPTFPRISAADLATATDTSYARMLSYRSDMRVALAPLLENRTAEFELYAQYVDTRDTSYLARLHTAASHYRDAATAAQKVVVPQDAAAGHIRAVNALQQFATVLDDMAAHAKDPLASLVLLRTYTAAEREMYESFNVLAAYYAGKKNV